MMVMNEKKYIENILNAGALPDDAIGESSKNYIQSLILKYGYSLGLRDQELVDYVFEKVKTLRKNDLSFKEYKFLPTLKKRIKDNAKEDIVPVLREIDEIPVYQAEINYLSTLPTIQERKFVFTCFILARVNNRDGWVNMKKTGLFKLANISMKKEKRNAFMRSLIEHGVITRNKKNDADNTKVELIPEGEIAGTVTSLENLGNQYSAKFREGYTQCKLCEKIFKKKTNNQQYCKTCSNQAEKINAKNRMAKMREKRNV